jgi:hypothetical protein
MPEALELPESHFTTIDEKAPSEDEDLLEKLSTDIKVLFQVNAMTALRCEHLLFIRRETLLPS